MYCSNCGKHNSEDSKFCQYCGTKLARKSTKSESVDKDKTDEILPQVEMNKSSSGDKTNIISNYFNVIKKYVDFNGRASRKEYWLFFLANFIIALSLGVVEGLVGIAPESEQSVFASIYQLFIFLPTLSVGIRRMHDTDRSGWFLIIPIYSFVVTLIHGNPETNKYGEPVKD